LAHGWSECAERHPWQIAARLLEFV